MTETTALDLLAKRVRHLETLEEIMSNIHGWDGTAWRKLPMVWGYSERWAEAKTTTEGAAGTRILAFTTVPEGEVWVALAADARNVNTDPSRVQFQVVVGAAITVLKRTPTPGVNIHTMWDGHIVLAFGDIFQVRFYTCALDDDVFANVLGYKMKVNE